MESEVKWTEGPWGVHPQRAVVVPAAHVSRPIGMAEDPAVDLATYAQEICLLQWPDPHRSEAEVRANARLIAAAPDLYEALEAARSSLSTFVGPDDSIALSVLSVIDTALARARGAQ